MQGSFRSNFAIVCNFCNTFAGSAAMFAKGATKFAELAPGFAKIPAIFSDKAAVSPC